MGSDSDLPVMKAAAETLQSFNILFYITVISAHRTPERAFAFAKSARADGYGVIIAGAGGAAHLAGVIAGITTLPVIGVPITSKSLSGADSLYSTVQMPPGVPVATVAIDGAMNAAILAIQILATGDPNLVKKLEAYKEELKEKVAQKAKTVESVF
jgi:5-(carboxyamino)imidazole ribonucleotide mutase